MSVLSDKQNRIGAHVSTAGGLYKSIEYAKDIGASTMQIFGASPRRWEVKMPSIEDINKYKKCLIENDIFPVYLHASYLVNIASINNILWKKSIDNLISHLTIAKLIDANGLILHIGSGKGMNKLKAIRKVVKALNTVLKNVNGSTELILENTAGGGDKIGSTFDELVTILDMINSKRIKICLDTAHAYESGMIKSYDGYFIRRFFDNWDEKIGIEKLVVIHVNDSKTKCGSHHDRHENIGKGYIGKVGFENLAKEKRIRNKPWILEVPGFANKGPDRENINILKSCFGTL